MRANSRRRWEGWAAARWLLHTPCRKKPSTLMTCKHPRSNKRVCVRPGRHHWGHPMQTPAQAVLECSNQGTTTDRPCTLPLPAGRQQYRGPPVLYMHAEPVDAVCSCSPANHLSGAHDTTAHNRCQTMGSPCQRGGRPGSTIPAALRGCTCRYMQGHAPPTVRLTASMGAACIQSCNKACTGIKKGDPPTPPRPARPPAEARASRNSRRGPRQGT
jgi:hypothetical protein